MMPNTVSVFSGGLARMLGFHSPNITRNHIMYTKPQNEMIEEVGPTSLNISKNNTLHVLVNIVSNSDNMVSIGGGGG